MSKFKIHKIEVDGEYETVRLTPWNYDKTCDYFRDEKKRILPAWSELTNIGDPDNLWALSSPHLTITAFDKAGNWRQWRFDCGFIWDQASVPIFRNNRIEAIIPAMPHDGAFSNHWYSFEETNRLFYQMCRAFGMGPIRAAIYYLAVNSMFGRAIWEKNQRAFWHKKTAHYMEGRAIHSHF